MCRIDEADMAEVLSEAHRTCRKPRKCNECGRMIGAGEKYSYTAAKANGDFFQSACCRHCVVVREWLAKECRGWCFGESYADITEHWTMAGYRTMRLARLIVGMRRKWTRRNGALMRVPMKLATDGGER